MAALTLIDAPTETCLDCRSPMEVVGNPGIRRYDYACPGCGTRKSSYALITVTNTKNGNQYEGYLIGKIEPVYVNHVMYHKMMIQIPSDRGADMCRDLSARMAYGRKPQITIRIEDGRQREEVIFMFNRGWMEDDQHTCIVLEEAGRTLMS